VRPELATILARPIAHRGLHDAGRGAIENSLAAAEAAVAGGYGIECDVQLTGDSEAVVFHDETLDRLTSETGPVSARTAAELEAIGLKGGGDSIPTLSAFLAAIAGHVPLVIEIKSLGDGDLRLAGRTAALAAAYRGPVALKSFDPAIIAHCRALGAVCPLGLVGPEQPGAAAPPEGFYDFLSWHIGELSSLRAARPTTPLMSWTVRSEDEHELAKSLGSQIVFERYRPAPKRFPLGWNHPSDKKPLSL
jgi:glycerophosphoryl diester phosphodiesterase